MIIARAPFRMSFFGGGTDYPPFFKENGGSVLSTTINKYAYVTVRHLPPFFDYTTQVYYSKIENVKAIEDLEHPLVREAMKYINVQQLHISYDADLPARSGLGTSSSFATAMISSFHALKGQYISSKKLAEEAIYVERTLCKESGGWQDQIAAAYGGFNRINFKENDFEVVPIILSQERKRLLNDNLMLFFTGFTRISSDIAKEQIKATDKKSKDLFELMDLVNDAEKILVDKHTDLNEFGNLLDHTWQLKRGITSRVSTNELDDIYSKACMNGAIGGKLLGAGGGGFFLFYVPKEKQPEVKRALKDLLHVPFKFEEQGTRILYYKPEDYDVNMEE
ncbi:MAG: kinase [Aminipila sp.]